MPGTLYFQKTKLLQFESKTPKSELGRSSSTNYHALGSIFARMSRVDDWRGGQRRLRFQSPLIEPYVRISRIRLSDKTSCLRPRKAVLKRLHADQPQGLVQVLIGEACDPLTALLVLLAQPPA
jgi:hypothetical protein